jgi:hypothetical protein
MQRTLISTMLEGRASLPAMQMQTGMDMVSAAGLSDVALLGHVYKTTSCRVMLAAISVGCWRQAQSAHGKLASCKSARASLGYAQHVDCVQHTVVCRGRCQHCY